MHKVRQETSDTWGHVRGVLPNAKVEPEPIRRKEEERAEKNVEPRKRLDVIWMATREKRAGQGDATADGKVPRHAASGIREDESAGVLGGAGMTDAKKDRIILLQSELIGLLLGQEAENGEQKNGGGGLTLKEYAERYFEQKKAQIRPTSYASYRWQYEHEILPSFGDMSLDEIDRKSLQDYANALLEKYKQKTVREYIARIREIMRAAMEDGLTKERSLAVKYPKRDKMEYDILTSEEYEELLRRVLDDKDKTATAILVALETGMRIGEICGLQWEDIDFKKHSISITKTVSRPCGGKIYIGDTKTEAGRRKIPMTKTLEEALKDRRMDPDVYVASGRERPTEPRTLRQAYARRMKKYGVRYIRFHDIRHTFCTRAIERGVDPKTLSAIVGHSNIKTTLDIYTSVTDEMMRSGMRKMDASDDEEVRFQERNT